MNDIEQDAFEILGPLILGQKVHLTKSHQAKISAICAIMFTMIDKEHLPTSGVSSAECSYIYENRMPPPTWHVFLGRVKAVDWNFRFRHTGTKSIPIDNLNYRPEFYNSQICTVGLQNLLLHVISHQDTDIIENPREYASTLRIKPIYPFVEEFDFLGLKRLRLSGASEVADGLVGELFEMGRNIMR